MLILKRNPGQRVLITDSRIPDDPGWWIEVTRSGSYSLSLGFDAPDCIEIVREELLAPRDVADR